VHELPLHRHQVHDRLHVAGHPIAGVAEASALPWVVTTTDTQAGATPPPFAFTTLSAISVSRSIADAGTGEPGTGPAKASFINRAQLSG
jgi:hypothetical protein